MTGSTETAAVAVGGALGGLARWLVGLAAGPVWSTLLVNLIGALAMGLLVGRLEARGGHPLLRPFAAVGLLGGWTTYSALALDLRGLLADGRSGLALLYLAATLVLGVGACVVGLVAAGRRWGGSVPDRGDGAEAVEDQP